MAKPTEKLRDRLLALAVRLEEISNEIESIRLEESIAEIPRLATISNLKDAQFRVILAFSILYRIREFSPNA